MASPVPYNPQFVPAQDRPIEPERLETPLGAFGGYTAEAVGHLGQVEDQAGNELFARAAAMQQLDQQSKALKATADYTTQLGQRFEQYRSLSGQDAVQGYQPFLDDVNSMREQFKGNLNSPFAQLQYDQDTRRIQSYVSMSAAAHAGDQAKAYNIGAEESRAKAAADIAASTNNYDAFKTSLDTTRAAYKQLGTINGWSPDRLNFETNSAISKSTLSYVNSLAKRSPYLAQQFLDQAQKDGNIIGIDYSNAQDFVQRQQYEVGSRQIASKTMAGVGGGDSPGTPDQWMAGAKAAEGGNYSFIGHVDTTNKEGQTGHPIGAYSVMSYNLGPWLREAGMPQMTEQQFVADHDAQDQLFKFKFGQYVEKYGSMNAAAHAWFGFGKDDGQTTADTYLQHFNAGIAHTSLTTAVANGRAMAEQERPGDLNFGDIVEQRINQLYEQNKRVQSDAELNNKMTVLSALNTPQGGKLPTDWNALIANPQFKTAYDSMSIMDQQWAKEQFAANITGKKDISTDDLSEYKRLRGIYLDPNATPSERAELLNKSDIADMRIPYQMTQQLMEMRKNIYNDSTAEPDMRLALKVMEPTLNSAGITKQPGDTDKTGDYWTYLADLKSSMEEYEQVYKAKPRPADIKEMGDMLIEQHKGFFGGINSGPITVPDRARAAIVDDFEASQHRSPYESEIRDAYIKAQFENYYQKKLKSAGQP